MSRSRSRSSQRSVWVLDERTPPVEDYYTLGRQIGQPGHFGKAVKGKDIKTGEAVAVKIINKARFAKSKDGLELFRREIAVMQNLKHEHVIDYLDVFEDAARLYIVMELCSGGELFDRITEMGKYSEKDASGVLRQLFTALAHIHAKKIAHCDLKPDNFLFTDRTKDAVVKVIDFGLAKFVKHREYFTKFCGTSYYVAPEILAKSFNESCDVWSLGVVMYVMLFGFPPFWEDPNTPNSDAKIYRKISKGFNPVTKKGYGAFFPASIPISDSAKDLISKLLQLDPLKRLTAAEALEHPWLTGESASDQPLVPTVIESLKSFTSKTKLKNVVLGLMVDVLSEPEVNDLKKTFSSLDEDGDQTVTIAELSKALRKVGDQDSEAEVDRLMSQLDTDGDGVLSYKELMMSYVHRKLNNKEERLWSAFNKLDLDGDGCITVDELKSVLGGQLGVDSEEVGELVKEADKDGNGVIDYDEFLSIMIDREAQRNEQQAEKLL